MASEGDAMSASPRPQIDLSGAVLEGAYRLVRLIGQGGMGAVYEALQLRLNKRVAIKLMSRELAANMVSLARFHREAEITSQLGHPHLVNVVDFGTAESGEPYLVMEFLDGEDLEQRLQKLGRLSLETTTLITRQVASALAAAHAQDIVHRDLKPANIFLLNVPGEPEFAKVLDFGISKVKAARARLTRATAVVGTPYYMSPEQATGRVDDTDHRADQWALACIAWEMLSGRTPFVGDDATALFYQIINVEPAPLARFVPGLPPGVEEVLRKALSKKFDDRYPTIRDFARAFETVTFGHPSDLTPPPQSITPGLAFDPATAGRVSAASPDPSAALVSGRQPTPPRSGSPAGADVVLVRTAEHTSELGGRGASWVRPALAVVVTAALVIVAAALFLFRSSGRPIEGAMTPTTASARSQAATPTEAPSAPSVVPIVVPERAAAPEPSQARPTKEVEPAARERGASKRKPNRSAAKRRIFQEL
jgi:serine/threonine protein kinase